MTSFSYRQLVHDTAVALGATPDAALVTFRVESRQETGLRSSVTTRPFELGVDEPPSLGGADTAPKPVEYALAALATCQEITYRLHADALGIPLAGVSVAFEGEINLRGLLVRTRRRSSSSSERDRPPTNPSTKPPPDTSTPLHQKGLPA